MLSQCTLAQSIEEAEDCCFYVLLFDYVNVRVCYLHNAHRTSHFENYKQHTAYLKLVALFP